MGVQQMMLGAAPLSVVATDAVNVVFLSEPSPSSTEVSATSYASASGGGGSYTYSWARVSGSVSIIPTSTTTASVTFYADVPKNSTLDAVWRVTVGDGMSTVTYDIAVSLAYMTDLI